jgi:hypothetical protein
MNPLQLSTATAFHRQQAYDVMDRFVAARDSVTGLVPLHVKTEEGHLVPTDHAASGLDMGRATSGLVMTAELAEADGDEQRADRYLEAARQNYEQGKKLLTRGDAFVMMRTFGDDGQVESTNVGEPGRSAPGQDDMTRVNPRGYAFRGAADLYRATGDPQYKADLERYFQAWVRDFHDDRNGGFFLHASVDRPGDHTERGTFMEPGGVPSSFDGSAGAQIIGNSGRLVRSLTGEGALEWDGRDDDGRVATAGVYFIRLRGSTLPPARVTLIR